MLQLPALPAKSQSPVTGAELTVASAHFADGSDGTAGVQGPNFGALLTSQIKGLAALLEGRGGGSKRSETPAVSEKGEVVSAAGDAAAVPISPLDLSMLQALALVSQPVSKPGIETPDAPPTSGGAAALAALGFSKAGKAKAAEIAVAGKGLPQAKSLDNRFSAKLMAATDGAMGHVEAQAALPDLSSATSRNDRFSEKLAAVTGGAMGHVEARAALSDLSSTTSQPINGAIDAAAVFRQPDDVAPASVPAQQVSPKVGSAEWGGAVGDKVLWMATQSHQVAELHLNPPNLGSLEVRLTVNNDQASALFVSHHAAVREAVETALPRLREMLADSGIMLGNVSVGAESFSQQQQAFDRKGRGRGGESGTPAMDGFVSHGVVGNVLSTGLARDGMVDIFA